jgi:hypothetical protein
MNRLEIISKESKEIHDKIYKASIDIKKEIILKTCDFVIKKTNINFPIVTEVLNFLKNNKELKKGQKEKLVRIESKFDDEYFKLREKEEAEGFKEKFFLIPFRKARAISTFIACFNTDLSFSTVEAVCEALAITDDNTDDKDELFSIIQKALGN